MRIVSLLASATEIVSALGGHDELVGRSHECDFPHTVLDLPTCSEPKIDIHTTSAEIDRQVKQTVADSLSVYKVDADKLKNLRPDVIVTQDHCEVCAVSLKDVEKAVCNWMDSRPTIVSLHPDALEDIWKNIRQVADAIDKRDNAEQLIQESLLRIDTVSKKCPELDQKLSVACIEWVDPLMAGGNWIPELVHLLNAECAFGEAGKHSPWMTFEDIISKDPDIIITLPCGFDIERSLEDMPILTQKEGWSDLKAVKNERVYVTDGNQYFNRPGPRVVESLEIMAEILYPDVFDFGHKGVGWQKFPTKSL